MALPKLMTVQQVMDYLAVSRSTVYRLIEKGHLCRVKAGSGTRITEDSLMAYLGHVRRSQ